MKATGVLATAFTGDNVNWDGDANSAETTGVTGNPNAIAAIYRMCC